MKIEVNYNELYNLGNYMENMFEELKKDFDEINVISETLNSVLQGSAEQTISTRMKNFNATQFSQIVNYTHLLGSEVTNCAKSYNAEDDEFAQKMKQEASKYGINDGEVVSDTRYQTQTTTSSFVTPTVAQSTTSTSNMTTTSVKENITTENIATENVVNESITGDTQTNNFDDIIIEEVESEVVNAQQVENITAVNETVNQVNSAEPSKSKGLFGGIFGAAATAMGIKFASNKKDEKENNAKK